MFVPETERLLQGPNKQTHSAVHLLFRASLHEGCQDALAHSTYVSCDRRPKELGKVPLSWVLLKLRALSKKPGVRNQEVLLSRMAGRQAQDNRYCMPVAMQTAMTPPQTLKIPSTIWDCAHQTTLIRNIQAPGHM